MDARLLRPILQQGFAGSAGRAGANAVRWINGPAGLRNGTGAPRTSDGVFIQVVPETREGGKGISLLARDVNSGVLLWKQAGSFLANESLVAIGGRVYTHQMILGQSKPQPLRGWNIRTGKLEKTYEAGLLIARKPWQGELYQVLVIGGDLVQVNTSEIRVLDIETGQLRWKKEGSFHRAAAGGSTIFLSVAKPDKPDREPGQRVKPVVWGVAVTALELASGKALWTKEARDFNLESLEPNEAIVSDLWYAQGKLGLVWWPRDSSAAKEQKKSSGYLMLLDAAKATPRPAGGA